MLFFIINGCSVQRSVEKLLSFVFTVDERNTWACFQLFDKSQLAWNKAAALASACISKTGTKRSTGFLFVTQPRKLEDEAVTVEMIRGSFLSVLVKHGRGCCVFPPATNQSRDERTKQRPRDQSDSPSAERDVTLAEWSNARRSCSLAAGCDTPGLHPGLSHPDWSSEVGISPSLVRSAQTLYSYSLPSSWKTHRDRKWWEQGNITAINLLSRIEKKSKVILGETVKISFHTDKWIMALLPALCSTQTLTLSCSSMSTVVINFHFLLKHYCTFTFIYQH